MFLCNLGMTDAYFIALFMFSYFNGTFPAIFEDYFTKNEYLHNYNTRSASNIHLDYQRTNYGEFSVKYRRAKLWNNLPEKLRNQKSYGQFYKRMIKE